MRLYLFKVGKYEHLELLKDGIVHFTPLVYFRGDGTAFRGDELEGKYLCQKLIIDGLELPGASAGAKIMLSHADSDDVLIFCASMLTQDNFQKYSPNSFVVEDLFFNEMRKFGQYAIVFNCIEFINNVKDALHGMRCNSAWGPVEYRDKKGNERMHRYIKKEPERDLDTEIYFIKDELYKLQNEWRFVIDWLNPSSMLKRNEDGSLDLKISPIRTSNIFDLDTARKNNEVTP